MTTDIAAKNGASKIEIEFYQSFEQADLEQMIATWATDDHYPACIHPHGPRLLGREEIKKSWKRILEKSPHLRLDIELIQQVEQNDLTIRYVNEHIYLDQQTVPEFTVLATNVYQLTDDGWRLVLHHASPGPESLSHARDQIRQQQNQDNEGLILH